MDELISLYQKNQEEKPKFSIVNIIDWYDGIVLGITKLAQNKILFLCNLVAWDMDKDEKVYSLIPLNKSFVKEYFKSEKLGQLGEKDYYNLKQNIADLYTKAEDSYLIKTKNLEDSNYNLIKIPFQDLKYYPDIEDVVNQEESEKKYWFNYFYE